jgi:hypothetical protein
MLLIVLAAGLGIGVASDVYELPPGSVAERWVDGPNGSVVAFYREPLPPDLFCGVGLGEMIRDLRRVGAFDAQGHRIWTSAVPPLFAILDAYVQPAGAVVVWGVPEGRGGLPRDAILFRLDAHGFDASFQVLKRSDLGGLGVMGQGMTSIVMAADGGLEIEGAFTSVRGQSRPGRARLRPDGSLDD